AEKLGRPTSYSEIFTILKEAQIVSENLCEKMIEITRFRNRLVHVYHSIDPALIFDIIQEEIEYSKLFMNAIKNFLKNKKETEK
ncbi:MAG: DUF86 domain-containing protein, partial [Candidatus Hodarchaeota archaeon]